LPNKWPADRVERRPIEALIPYARNSRTHSDAQVAQIAASMKEWGWTSPILIDETGMIIAGHGRVLAARKLGLAEVPVMVAEGWTEPQKRAYVLADNQLALNAGWDMDMLSNELADLQAQGFDLELTGFSDIDALLAGRGTAGLTDPDAVPEPGARAVATRWPRLATCGSWGGHRLVCGDSTDAAAVGACLGQERPHLMVTDPPYGVEYDPKWREAAGINKNQAKMGKVLNDDRADWTEAWALFPGDVAYVWHAGKYTREVQNSLEACTFEVRSQIIWAKDRFALSRGDYHWQHEPCWYVVRKGSKGHWHGDRKQSTVWNIKARDDAGVGHGTQKPVECMRRPMENNSVAGNAVYEPFSGSGTTIIAGEQCGRRVLAIELNPIYVDVAIKRWQDFTGKLATLESTGQTFEDVADARYDWRKDGFDSYEVWCAAKREELVKAGKAA
jgi:DNA modification methylase